MVFYNIIIRRNIRYKVAEIGKEALNNKVVTKTRRIKQASVNGKVIIYYRRIK